MFWFNSFVNFYSFEKVNVLFWLRDTYMYTIYEKFGCFKWSFSSWLGQKVKHRPYICDIYIYVKYIYIY